MEVGLRQCCQLDDFRNFAKPNYIQFTKGEIFAYFKSGKKIK